MCIITKQGKRWYSWLDLPIRDADTGQSAIRSIGRDVTEHKRTESALRVVAQSEGQLAAADVSVPLQPAACVFEAAQEKPVRGGRVAGVRLDRAFQRVLQLADIAEGGALARLGFEADAAGVLPAVDERTEALLTRVESLFPAGARDAFGVQKPLSRQFAQVAQAGNVQTFQGVHQGHGGSQRD